MLGAGNVASHLSRHFHAAGHHILCIYSRNREHAAHLAGELGTEGTSNPGDLPRRADFYIIAVTDSAVEKVAAQFRRCKGIWLHTAGAITMDCFEGIHPGFGVLYPLQSFTMERKIQMEEVPLLVEGSDLEVTGEIRKLGMSISGSVLEVDSPTRLMIHLAAVFANNFSNHMANIAGQLLDAGRLDRNLLAPLLEETFRKIVELGAADAQTGPAVRDDRATMRKHLELLKEYPEWEKLYTFISRDIGRSRNDS